MSGLVAQATWEGGGPTSCHEPCSPAPGADLAGFPFASSDDPYIHPLHPILSITNRLTVQINGCNWVHYWFHASNRLSTDHARIEGSKLTDRELEKLLSNLAIQAFETRDEQEVADYAYVPC